MQEIQAILTQIAPEYWALIVAGGAIVAVTLEAIKFLFRKKLVDKKKTVTFLLGALSFATTLAEYLITAAPQDLSFLGAYTPAVIGAAVFFHRFAVNPVVDKVVKNVASLVTDARAYRATQASVLAPAPIETEPQVFQV